MSGSPYSDAEGEAARFMEQMRQKAALALIIAQFKQHVYLDALKPHRGRDKRLGI